MGFLLYQLVSDGSNRHDPNHLAEAGVHRSGLLDPLAKEKGTDCFNKRSVPWVFFKRNGLAERRFRCDANLSLGRAVAIGIDDALSAPAVRVGLDGNATLDSAGNKTLDLDIFQVEFLGHRKSS